MKSTTESRGTPLEDGWCDLLVVGSGAAGLTAAVTACHLGLRVRVVEKTSWIGGTTALSEGMIWVPCAHHAREQGIADSRDAALDYLRAVAGKYFDEERARSYVRHAPRMLAFVEANTHARFELVRGSLDYEPDKPGSLRGGRALRPVVFDGRRLGSDFEHLRWPLATTMLWGRMTIASADLPHFFNLGHCWRARLLVLRLVARYARDRLSGWRRGTRLANGNGLVAALALTLQEHRVDVQRNARLDRLVLDGGRVVGAVIDIAGESRLVRVRHGVVLAAGGFSGNAALKRKHFPHVKAGKCHVDIAPAENTGDALSAAVEIGASMSADLSSPAAWSPVSLVPQADGAKVPFPHYLDRGKPGVICVTGQGKRFVNEASCYHDFVEAMLESCSGQLQVEAFLIADRRAIARYGLGAAPPSPGRLMPFIRSGYLTRAATLGELERLLGMPSGSLVSTVEEFNAEAAHGRDPAFGKGGDDYQRASGDASVEPNPCVAPLRSPPYYAVRIHPGDIATFVGLRTDSEARVVDEAGRPIPGLFAAGNDMLTVMGGRYPAAGITIGAAMTFGYVAARAAADTASR